MKIGRMVAAEDLQPGLDLRKIIDMKRKLLHFSFLILSFGLIMTACGVVDSPQETEETMLPTTTWVESNDNYWIRINNVQVRENDLIAFLGSTNIPEGNCIYTELYADEKLLSWWPVGKCFPITGADWQFSVLLGEEGAPDRLDTEVQYSLQIYWPGAPNSVRAAFPFDLASPPGN